MTDKDWVQVAMGDDSLVAETLLRLHQAEPPPPITRPLKLEWSVRQRRSKTAAAPPPSMKKGDQTSASPTTPLSWSVATSVSGGGGGAADGFEESSCPIKPSENIRSKVSVTSGTTPFKKSRRKKTIAELKEEESLLLKERRSLKSELASMRLVFEKQRARNEILKKIKVDSSKNEIVERKESVFLLPDLNLTPHNDSKPEILHGTG